MCLFAHAQAEVFGTYPDRLSAVKAVVWLWKGQMACILAIECCSAAVGKFGERAMRCMRRSW